MQSVPCKWKNGMALLVGDLMLVGNVEDEEEIITGFSGLGDLRVWRDGEARSAATNMAVDELLLRGLDGSRPAAATPILRYYDWARPAVSIGYFQCWRDTLAPAEEAELDWVRRWTGGGRVDHRVDITYTLLVPREHPFSLLSPRANYRWVHDCVVKALQAVGEKAALTHTGEAFAPRRGASPNCFDSPVPFDVVNDEGGKLAGAAQRRTRQGLLHQGSVMESGIGAQRENWQMELAGLLSGGRSAEMDWEPPAGCLAETEALAREKYASEEWLKKF
jgi:lipoate-protein ligase A